MKQLSAFTLIEVLVTLTMISFLTLTGLKMGYQHLSWFRFSRFEMSFSEQLDELTKYALAGMTFSEGDRWHLYGESENGELILRRIQSSAHPESSDLRVVTYFEELEVDHFPLKLSGLELAAEELSTSGNSFLLSWRDALHLWEITLLNESMSLEEGDGFFNPEEQGCLSDCLLSFDLAESDVHAYHFSLSSLGELSKVRLFLL
jgi:type II secretory pathway pseudopilin PulG